MFKGCGGVLVLVQLAFGGCFRVKDDWIGNSSRNKTLKRSGAKGGDGSVKKKERWAHTTRHNDQGRFNMLAAIRERAAY